MMVHVFFFPHFFHISHIFPPQFTGQQSSDNHIPARSDSQAGAPSKGAFGSLAANYIDSVSSAANLTVLAQLFAIGLLLTFLSGCTALIFILRYDPLYILSTRD